MNKSATGNDADLMRQLPSVDLLLQQSRNLVQRYGHDAVREKIRSVLDRARQSILAGDTRDADSMTDDLLRSLATSLARDDAPSLVPVFNLTGTILHTNLGRAQLPETALRAITRAAEFPLNLEFDLVSGKRGERDDHMEGLVCELTGAQAATVVNNNAAAVLLVLNTLARGGEVPVSRGELVEIGGSFRIPEVMERSGCTLVEIGATNRTHLRDYDNAITANTSLLMKVHTSNYRIEGFTAEVSERDLAALARQHGLPFVLDMGSGCLLDLSSFGLPAEATVADAIAAGADLVTFSGDKLLGGPQCGIIAGRKDLVEQVRSNPLKRALRLDKMTLAALVEVLRLYRNPEALCDTLPALRQFTRPMESIRKTAETVAAALKKNLGGNVSVTVEDARCQIGSGALPVESIPSVAVVLTAEKGGDRAIRQLAGALRGLPRPVIGRLHNGRLLLDMRCLEEHSAFTGQLPKLGRLQQ